MESQLYIDGHVNSQEQSFELNANRDGLQSQLEEDAQKAQETEAYRERIRCLPKLPGKVIK